MRNNFCRLVIASCALLSFGGCPPGVTVDPDDMTPPEIRAVLVSASQFDAQYDSGELIEGLLDPSREFSINVSSDRRQIQVLFSATDMQSGIRRLNATLAVSFTCQASVSGGPVESEESVTFFSDPFLVPADPGDVVSEGTAVTVGFNMEDLWRKGFCSTWGQIINVNTGTIANVRVEYTAAAQNNAQLPISEITSDLSGQFTANDVSVNLDE